MSFKIAPSRASVLAVVLVAGLSGCPTAPHPPESASGAAVEQSATPASSGAPPPAGNTPLGAPGAKKVPGHPAPPHSLQVPGRQGGPYDVASRESLLTIIVFRGGALGKVGHNHVIASRDVTGTFYVPADVVHTTFELHVPVAQLTIDEPELRAKEGPDFPTDVPDSAKEGTRRNMLSEALLNGAEFPDITLTSDRLEPRAPAGDAATLQAHVAITIRGHTHSVAVPVRYSIKAGKLVASGELALKQTDLGLTPFSALFGALQVQDELRIRFQIVAAAAQVKGGPATEPRARPTIPVPRTPSAAPRA